MAPYPRIKRRHPVVLSPGEVVRLLKSIRNVKHRTVAMVLYGAGLRISEALALELRDIDSARMVITVRHGKGDSDRQVALSVVLLDALRTYWVAYKPAGCLFPGADPEKPMVSSTPVSAFGRKRTLGGISSAPNPAIRNFRPSECPLTTQSGHSDRTVPAP